MNKKCEVKEECEEKKENGNIKWRKLTGRRRKRNKQMKKERKKQRKKKKKKEK